MRSQLSLIDEVPVYVDRNLCRNRFQPKHSSARFWLLFRPLREKGIARIGRFLFKDNGQKQSKTPAATGETE